MRPGQLDPLRLQQGLEILQPSAVLAHGAGRHAARQAERRQQPGGLADVSLDGVQPIAAVGDVRAANVLARRERVTHSHRDQGTQRDLKGQRGDVVESTGQNTRRTKDPVPNAWIPWKPARSL